MPQTATPIPTSAPKDETKLKQNLEKYEQIRLKYEGKQTSTLISKALKRITHDCKRSNSNLLYRYALADKNKWT